MAPTTQQNWWWDLQGCLPEPRRQTGTILLLVFDVNVHWAGLFLSKYSPRLFFQFNTRHQTLQDMKLYHKIHTIAVVHEPGASTMPVHTLAIFVLIWLSQIIWYSKYCTVMCSLSLDRRLNHLRVQNCGLLRWLLFLLRIDVIPQRVFVIWQRGHVLRHNFLPTLVTDILAEPGDSTTCFIQQPGKCASS